MPLPQFIMRRGQRLYYRRAFPKDVWPVTGKGRSFTVALGTADPAEALKARPEAERRYHAKVDQARAELARQADARPINEADASRLAVQWFLEAVEAWAPQPRDEGELLEALDMEELFELDAREALSLGNDGQGTTAMNATDVAGRLRRLDGLLPNEAAEAALRTLLRRAAVAAHQVRLGRLKGDYGARPDDLLFASAMEGTGGVAATPAATAKPSEGRTVADLEKAFRASKLTSLAPGTATGYEPVFRLLRNILGADLPLAAIGHDEGQRLFETVKRLPINAEKLSATKGLPVLDQIKEAKRLGLKTLSAKTINDRYMASLGALFRWAEDRGWMSRNPVRGLRARDEVAAADRREPFGAERLKVLFGSAPWTPRDVTGEGRPIRYWGPLLALYHGLRLGEVAGLEVGHVTEEGGTPLLLIRAGKRQLKTRSARRDIPVHPELIRLGFMEFTAERKKGAARDALLFVGERTYARQQWGRGLGDWFVRKVRGLGLTGRKLTFHSLRHDFRDALREAEVEPALADYIMGHAPEGTGAQYGASRPSLARLQAALAKVRFSQVSGP